MTSRALIVAPAWYAPGSGIDSHAEIENSGKLYGEYLGRDPRWGPGQVTVLANDQLGSDTSVLDAVYRAAAETSADGILLIIYIGHGEYWDNVPGAPVYFSVGGSRRGRSDTYLSSIDLYRAMRLSDARFKVLIADSCKSHHLNILGGAKPPPSLGVIGEPSAGTCVLTAVRDYDWAGSEGCDSEQMPEELRTCTAFSGHLLNVLGQGVPGGGDLTIGTLCSKVESDMRGCRANREHPLPGIIEKDFSHNIPVFTNNQGQPSGQRREDVPGSAAEWVRALLDGRWHLQDHLLADPGLTGEVVSALEQRGRSARHVAEQVNDRATRAFTDPGAFARYWAEVTRGLSRRPGGSDVYGWAGSHLYDWVSNFEVAEIAGRVEAVRGGPGPDPAEAARILQVFALRRDIDDLLELEPSPDGRGRFDPLDEGWILELAALRRPVADAAELAVRHWKKESAADPARTPLTDSIVHGVTAQRTIPEVAEFIGICRERGPAELVGKILARYAGAESGRTGIDKAMLYFILRDKGCAGEAGDLLRLILEQAMLGASVSLPERKGVVAAFHHLSPAEPIVGEWLARRTRSVQTEEDAVRIAAALLVEDPPGADPLARYLGGRWDSPHVVLLCGNLLKEKAAEDCFGRVRRYAAARADTERLYQLIRDWHASEDLPGTLADLLADIVAPGAPDDPRPIAFLDDLHTTLGTRGVDPVCGDKLRIAVARHIDGRGGGEMAASLGQVRGRRELRNVTGHRDQKAAADHVNERLAAGLFDGTVAVGTVVDYFAGLHRLGRAGKDLVFWAESRVADPEQPRDPAGVAGAVADVAVGLYGLRGPGGVRGTGDGQGLDDRAFALLHRFLENAQFVTPEAVVAVCGRVRRDRDMHADKRWNVKLRTSVGRWLEARSREDVVDALRSAGMPEDAEAILA